MFATEHLEAKRTRVPAFGLVGEQGHAGDWAVVALKPAVVINEHPFGEFRLRAALHFDVEVDPVFCSRQTGDADQFVDQALTEFSVLHHGAEFLIKEFVARKPVDAGIRGREIEGHEFRKVVLDGFFPWAVAIVADL